MAHRTKINGTTYEIKGGRTKVNGTGYGISKGRTKLGGTGYDVAFSSLVTITLGDFSSGNVFQVEAGSRFADWASGSGLHSFCYNNGPIYVEITDLTGVPGGYYYVYMGNGSAVPGGLLAYQGEGGYYLVTPDSAVKGGIYVFVTDTTKFVGVL